MQVQVTMLPLFAAPAMGHVPAAPVAAAASAEYRNRKMTLCPTAGRYFLYIFDLVSGYISLSRLVFLRNVKVSGRVLSFGRLLIGGTALYAEQKIFRHGGAAVWADTAVFQNG